MVLMLAIVEFSYAFLTVAAVSNAARVGVRSYVIGYASPGAEATAINLARDATPNPANVVGGTFSEPCVPMGQTTLTLTYRYTSLTGWFDGLLGSPVTLRGTGSMQCGG